MRCIGTARGPNQPGKDRGPHTLPFHRPKTHATLPRGFMRQAELVDPLPTGPANAAGCTSYRCACALYKDKCTFFIVHTAHVEAFSVDDVIMRGQVGGGKVKKPQQSFVAHLRYNEYYGGVDMLDASVGFFGIHKCIKPARWHLRPAFWMLDVLANNMWQIALHHIGGGKSRFYSQFAEGPRVGNHRLFLITLGQHLIDMGVQLNNAAPVDAQVAFTPQRLHTPSIWRRAADARERIHAGKKAASVMDADDSDEQEPQPTIKRFRRHDTPTALPPGHEMSTFQKRDRCAGCSLLLSRHSGIFGEKGREAIPRLKRGCKACSAVLCEACEGIWNHEYGAITHQPPRGWVSWSAWIKKQKE